MIRKIEKFIGLPIYTAPEKKVWIEGRGLKIQVSALAAVPFQQALAILSAGDPDGTATVSDNLKLLEAARNGRQ